jgi:enoyl-CoA hydratase
MTRQSNGGAYECLTVEKRGYVTEVTFSRPALLNRFDEAMHDEFPMAVRAARADPDTRAIVLASTGRVFSAGGDFEWMREMNADLAARVKSLDHGRDLLDSLLDCPIPIVAALHADAFGLGATVVLSCDAVVTHRGAGLADTHVPIGLVAGDGGCVVWPAAAGLMRAKRHLLTGDRLGAEDAYAMGLVTDLVDGPDDVLPAARALADRLAGLPPLAVQGTKRALNRLAKARAAEVVEVSFAYEGFSLGSADLLEAVNAFKERRPGRYEGR